MTTEIDQRISRMRERASEPHPEAFQFSDTESEFAGVFRELKLVPGASRFGAADVVVFDNVVIPAGSGPRSIFLYHTVLKNRLKEAAPVTGELVFIKYHGTEENAEGSLYHNYTVVVDGRSGTGRTWEDVDESPVLFGNGEPPTVPQLGPPEGGYKEPDDIPF
jgi:hypothetical protein